MATLKWPDIWLLQSMRISGESDDKFDLSRIVAAADGINHAILTFEEFNNGLYRLREAGLIELNFPRYAFTPSALDLFQKFEGQSYMKQMDSIGLNVGAEKWSEGYIPKLLESPEIFVSKGNFNNAVSAYLKRYGL
jgi:hypothetical protein